MYSVSIGAACPLCFHRYHQRWRRQSENSSSRTSVVCSGSVFAQTVGDFCRTRNEIRVDGRQSN